MDILSGRKNASMAGLTLDNYQGNPSGLTLDGYQPLQTMEPQPVIATADKGMSDLVGPLSAVNPILGAALAIGDAVVRSNKNRVIKVGNKQLQSAQRANISMYEDLAEGQEENQRMLDSANIISSQYL
jgi:hypothetical protein